MTEPAKTYTRIEAAEIFGVSNTIVRRNLKAVLEFGFDESLLLRDNRLTEEAIELIRLYRAKEPAALQTMAEAFATSEAPAIHVNATVETAPASQSAATMRRADAANSNALTTQERTAALSKFEVPKADLEIPDIDVDDLRALLGLSTSASSAADAHRANSDAYQKQIDTLKALKDELDEAAIVADEKARIAREKELRAKVRAADMGNDLKAAVAVA